MPALKSLARDWLPPAVARWLRRHLGRETRFSGDFASWQAAAARCTGYDADVVFQRACEAARQVKRGEALFERDSVCFHQEEYRWEPLACLALAAAESGGVLRVLDFGGSLGSFYFQHRGLLGVQGGLRWGVVEQHRYVECGRREFEDHALKFYESIAECAYNMHPNVILLSSVLQYLEKPYETLEELGRQNVPYIIVDRTPFCGAEKDRLVIQHVARSIYPASYPMWGLSEHRFEGALGALGYRRIARWRNAEGDVGRVQFCGALYRRVAA